MKELMNEYGSLFLGGTGLVLFFGTMGGVLLAENGVLMQMIQAWLYGGV